jgi:hypothetical protein
MAFRSVDPHRDAPRTDADSSRKLRGGETPERLRLLCVRGALLVDRIELLGRYLLAPGVLDRARHVASLDARAGTTNDDDPTLHAAKSGGAVKRSDSEGALEKLLAKEPALKGVAVNVRGHADRRPETPVDRNARERR